MNLASEIRQLLGNDAVADDPETLAEHSGDKWFAAEQPEAVVFARSTADVSNLLKFASKREIPVTGRGAGYGYVGGCVPARRGIALSLRSTLLTRSQSSNPVSSHRISKQRPGLKSFFIRRTRRAWIIARLAETSPLTRVVRVA
jgi:hypothetical protein